MLVLSRKVGEAIVIGDNIRITVLAICGSRVQLGLNAPAEVSILRDELYPAGDQTAGPVCLEKGTRPWSGR